jgi:hypothetical protein
VESNEEKHFNQLHDAAYELSVAMCAHKPAAIIDALRAKLDAELEAYWAANEASRLEEDPADHPYNEVAP